MYGTYIKAATILCAKSGLTMSVHCLMDNHLTLKTTAILVSYK